MENKKSIIVQTKDNYYFRYDYGRCSIENDNRVVNVFDTINRTIHLTVPFENISYIKFE